MSRSQHHRPRRAAEVRLACSVSSPSLQVAARAPARGSWLVWGDQGPVELFDEHWQSPLRAGVADADLIGLIIEVDPTWLAGPLWATAPDDGSRAEGTGRWALLVYGATEGEVCDELDRRLGVDVRGFRRVPTDEPEDAA